MIKLLRDISKNTILILIPAIFSTYLISLTANIRQDLQHLIELIQLLLWNLVLGLLIFKIIISRKALAICHNWQYKQKIRNPKIAIIREEGCPLYFTSITPKDWFDFFKRNKFKVEYIKSNQSYRNYTFILNPYGEIYPESDLVELKTLRRIKRYIQEGGLFFNGGGCAFYYGWHTIYHKPQRLAKELQTYKMDNDKILHPILYPATSLVDMPLFDFFRVSVSTSEKPNYLTYFQNQEDKKIVGDLMGFNSNKIEEFRAVREPAPHCIPFIRTKINDSFEVYPICAIKVNDGFLLLAGINLNSVMDINKAQMELIGKSIISFLAYLKRIN